MNTLEYENLYERKSHVSPQFPYNTYLCSIPLDFTLVPAHWHNDVELIVIKKGTGTIAVDMEPQTVSAGDIILVRPGQIHSISQHDNDTMEYENILFRPDLLYSQNTDLRTLEYFDLYFNPEYNLPWHIDHSNSCHKKLAECINAIDTLCGERPRYYELSVKGYLFQFFYLLFSCQESPVYSTGRKSLDKVKKMIAYIQEHYAETITLDMLCRAGGVGRTACTKLFQKYANTTPINYVRHYRVAKSIELLQNSDMPVTQIACETGFSGASFFAKTFKEITGITPGQMKKGGWTDA